MVRPLMGDGEGQQRLAMAHELDPEGALAQALVAKLAVSEDGARLHAEEDLHMALDAFLGRLYPVLVEEGGEDAASIDGLAEYATQRLGPRQARLVAFVYVLPGTKAPLVVDYDLFRDGTTFERVEVGYGWAQGAQRRSDPKAFHRLQNDPWADACGVCLRWE